MANETADALAAGSAPRQTDFDRLVDEALAKSDEEIERRVQQSPEARAFASVPAPAVAAESWAKILSDDG